MIYSFSFESSIWSCFILAQSKIQQTKMLVTCQRFGELFLFGLVWQYSSIQKNIIKVGSKSWILTCSCHIILSLPFYTYPASKRELNFCNGYLSMLYFCVYHLLYLVTALQTLSTTTKGPHFICWNSKDTQYFTGTMVFYFIVLSNQTTHKLLN